ncbi:hypothetical protein PROQFM164_S01g003065 [Penicillium roqueforti FM164]|uniref:Uncharacterized protein n=1 Tax=Penicillium roqueforti (strain FM164) TaxID=1365484 RepID=W6PYC2_PENRF|nr:hypothetical protein PROQFM164_S01g003065 [Penicillium roqueforti FM164]
MLIGYIYTHYYAILGWDTPEWQKAWAQLIEDIPKIIKEGRVPLTGSEKGINLNGVGEDAYEQFILCKPGQWTFCKTAERPYDVVVTSILLRGCWRRRILILDWADARRLCATLWPGEPTDSMWAQDDEGKDVEAKDLSDQVN